MNKECCTEVLIKLSICDFGALDLQHWLSRIDEVEKQIKSAPNDSTRRAWQSCKDYYLLELSKAVKRNIAPSSLQEISFKGDNQC